METIEKSIEVDQPIRSVYNLWTQFESFPLFMEGVKSVRQVNEKRLIWHVEIAGITKTWEAEIVEQVPDSRIAWHSTSGAVNNGMVLFEALEPERTLVTLILNYGKGGGCAGASLVKGPGGSPTVQRYDGETDDYCGRLAR
jgi:uncharacterized membrane protein